MYVTDFVEGLMNVYQFHKCTEYKYCKQTVMQLSSAERLNKLNINSTQKFFMKNHSMLNISNAYPLCNVGSSAISLKRTLI